jgi:hypothetical protein
VPGAVITCGARMSPPKSACASCASTGADDQSPTAARRRTSFRREALDRHPWWTCYSADTHARHGADWADGNSNALDRDEPNDRRIWADSGMRTPSRRGRTQRGAVQEQRICLDLQQLRGVASLPRVSAAA